MASQDAVIFPVRTAVGIINISANVRNTSNNWIVFLHGWGCAKETFDSAFDLEKLKDFSMCAIDLPGFGRSDRPHDFSYDLADHAKVVSEVIKSLGAKRVILVGHSMGGGIGLIAAKVFLDKLKLFVNIEGNLVPTDSRAMRKLAGHGYPMFNRLYFPLIKKTIRSSKRADNIKWSKWLDYADPWAAYQSARSATRWSDNGQLLPMFLGLSDKVYVYGENSVRVPHILPKLHGVETRKIVRSEHFPMIDNPQNFYTTLEELIMKGSK